MILRSLPLLAVVLAISSCGGTDQGAPGHTFTLTRSDGVETAVNSAVPRYEGELFTYEEIAQVQEGESEESLLSRPGMAVLDEDGAFYIVDRAGSESRIAVFAPDGAFVRSIGRTGSGPGEFRSPVIEAVSEGVILTLDRSLGRLQRFSADGILLDVTSLPEPPERVIWRAMYPADQAARVLIGEEVPMIAPGSTELETSMYAEVFSAAWDSLAMIRGQAIGGGKIVSTQSGTRFISSIYRPMYGPVSGMIYDPALGIVVTDGEEPVIDLYGLDGTLRRRIRIEFAPKPLTDADRERVEGPIRRRLEEGAENTRAMAKQQLEYTTFSDPKAYWGESGSGWLQADHGYLWIRVNRANESPDWPETTTRFMVLSPQGEFLGYMTLPTHRRGMALVRAGRLVTGHIDEETGVIGFRSWRIVPAVEGLDYP